MLVGYFYSCAKFVASALVVLLSFVYPSSAKGEGVTNQTLEVAERLSMAQWTEIAPGLRQIGTASQAGTTINALEFLQSRFLVELAIQSNATGERANSVGERLNAVAVINAGFFRQDAQNRLAAVGLLSVEGKRSGRNWNTAGGYLVLGDNLMVRPTLLGPPKGNASFVQSKPVLIEPGGNWAMNTNQGNLKRRTLICLKPDRVIAVIIAGRGMSLFEAGWLLRSPEYGGFFDCDSAIAMDGGGSTQSWVNGNSDLSVRGISPVHNFLVFKRMVE